MSVCKEIEISERLSVYSDTNPPQTCPNGHSLGPRRVLVGWDNLHDPPCRTWTCTRCWAVIHEADSEGPSRTTSVGL